MKCTVLVMGRDASVGHCYITSFFLKKFWADCPYEKVLCTQSIAPDDCVYDRVIYTDKDLIWGDRLNEALKNISTEYVILLAEDFFLRNYVSNSKIEACIRLCEEESGGAVRLNPPVPFSEHYNEDFDILPPNSIYRICLQPTLFKKDYLQKFAESHFSPWQFERVGSLMSRDFEEMTFCTITPVYDCIHAWSHGMWDKEAYKLMEQSGIDKTLYEGKKIYPWYMTLRDKLYIKIIGIAPDLITKVRIRMCEKNEKKLNS